MPDMPIDLIAHDSRDSVALLIDAFTEINDMRARIAELEDALAGGGGGGITKSPVELVVASADMPVAVKNAADFVCTGTGDHLVAQQAFDRAGMLFSRNGTSVPSAQQRARVRFTGGRFNFGGAVKVPTAVHGCGAGRGTEIRAVNNNDTGLFKLAAPSSHLITLSDMYLYGNYGSGGSCHGIDLDMTPTSTDSGVTTGYPSSSPDADHALHDLFIDGFEGGTRHAIYKHSVNNTFGTAKHRGSILSRLQIRNCSGNGIWLSGSSDNFISNCHIGTVGNSCYRVEGGNTVVDACKSFFSDQNGFYFGSGRATVNGCTSQDDNLGFYFDAAPSTVSGITVDTANVAAIQASTDRLVLAAFSIFWRASARYAVTQRGLYFDSTYADMTILGQSDDASITNPVVGTVGARSFMRVSTGTSLLAVG